MGDANHIRTLRDYSKPSHEGYINTIELPVGNNVVPLRSDTIRLVQNGCSFHGLRFEDPNQHLKDFLKLVDSLDLDGSITTWEDLTTRFLAQFFPPGKTAKLHNDILMFQQHQGESLSEAWTRFKDLLKKVPHHGIDLWLQDLSLHENESWNDPRDFAKPVKAISLPQDVPSTSDRYLIELENQVQRLMEAHLDPMQPTQVNKITSSCEICSGPHDTQCYMENPEQAFVEYASSRTEEAEGKLYTFKLEQNNLGDTYNPSWKSHPNLRWRQPQNFQNNFSNPPNRFQPNGLIPNHSFKNNPQNFNSQSNLQGFVSNFMAYQDARLSKFEADFKRQKSEMTNKIDTVLKAITDRMAGPLPSDTVKNPKLNVNTTTLVLSARSYPTEDPECSTHIHEERERKGDPEDANTITYNKGQRDTPQLEQEDITVIDNLGPNRDDEGIEWLDVERPLDLVDTSEELAYESLIKEMPKCSLNYDFKIKKGDPRNLKIPCMIGHKFTANAYIDVGLPMNIMSLTYYNSIRKNGYEYRGRNFAGLGRDMHVFVGNMSYVIDFIILENIETNIDPSLSYVIFGRPFVEIACLAIIRKHGLMTFTDIIKEITFKTPYKDPYRSELSSESHDLLPSRVILSEDDYDRGCRKPSELDDGFIRTSLSLDPDI
ncbi:protein kinase-like domain, concanavalin A-like lectin/glucanase domain protein [Tanacetum coccineum]